MGYSRRYATMDDLVEHEVIPALTDFADDFDVEAIADETAKWDGQGFVIDVDAETFWKVAESHAL